jgi:hypothetical protein
MSFIDLFHAEKYLFHTDATSTPSVVPFLCQLVHIVSWYNAPKKAAKCIVFLGTQSVTDILSGGSITSGIGIPSPFLFAIISTCSLNKKRP